MYFRWAQIMLVPCGKFFHHELVEELLDVLEVRHIARGAKDGRVADSLQTLNGLEASERAVRS